MHCVLLPFQADTFVKSLFSKCATVDARGRYLYARAISRHPGLRATGNLLLQDECAPWEQSAAAAAAAAETIARS